MCEKKMIRALNDELRANMNNSELGIVVVTSGINAMGAIVMKAILRHVKNYDAFTTDNDPHGEHDFGSFEYGLDTINWKIDYYDIDFRCGSENPASAADTKRVLTVMLASEF